MTDPSRPEQPGDQPPKPDRTYYPNKLRGVRRRRRGVKKRHKCDACQERKRALNRLIPHAGDAVEWIANKTGLDRLFEDPQP